MKKSQSVQLQQLTTGYAGHGKIRAISRDLSADLWKGELTCLLGPNGAGKSTLLRTLSAFIPPVSGTILINHQPLSTYSNRELARLIGVVLTDRLDVRDMSVRDLVALGRSPYTGFFGSLSDNDKRIIQDSLETTGTVPLSNRMLHTLSDGERQKALIAKTLAQQTPIILLDEPTAFLDYPSKVELMQLLRRLARKKGMTVFLSTHDLELALQVADRLWLLDQKKGLTTGTPEDLALNGLLGQYFERSCIYFSIETGLFQVNEPTCQEITASGPENILRLIGKSMARHGVRIAPTRQNINSASPHIEVCPDPEKKFCFEYFWYSGIGPRQKFKTIEELTDAVTT